jgi:hypothetical protein
MQGRRVSDTLGLSWADYVAIDSQLDAVESVFLSMADMTGKELRDYRDTFGHTSEFWGLLFDVCRRWGVW